MKILFIYPNAGSQLGFNYGVAHMAGVLKTAGHEASCQQLCEDIAPLPDREAFIAGIREAAPDAVGFSVVTNQWPYTRELAAWAREATDAPLICGGIHATVAAEQVLETGLFDAVMVGECDEAILDYVGRLERGEPVADMPNLGTRAADGSVRVNPVRPLPDLRRLPPKDYEVFDFQSIIDAKRGWVGLMASRGCPFRCSYCFNHFMVAKYRADLACSFADLNYIRHHDVGQVIDEIDHLQRTYRNIRMFIFDDDLFTFDRDYVVEFCRAYRTVSDKPFVVNGHVGFLDEARCRALAEAGCRIVKFGLESGSPRIRDSILNRRMTNDRIVEAVELVHRFGMHSSAFVMIGLPDEGRDDLQQTIDLLGRAEPSRFRWTFFYPFPGTRAYELAVEGGYVDFGRMDHLMNFTDGTCLDFGPEHNLLLEKVGRIMPWFVNAAGRLPVADAYRERVDRLLEMDRDEWGRVSPGLHAEDKRLSAELRSAGRVHYAVKYNPFMGVRSDHFLDDL